MEEEYLLDLMAQKAAGIISSQDDELLMKTLRQDPALQQRWETMLHTSVPDATGMTTEEAWNEITERYRSSRRRRRFAGWAAASTLACVAILFLLFGRKKRSQDPLSAGVLLQLSTGGNYRLDSGRHALTLTSAVFMTDSIGMQIRGKGAGNPEPSWHHVITKPGYPYKLILPDGSNVLLDGSTRCSFPAAGSIREMRLEGSALFQIASNTAQPFRLQANGIDITVTGTVFNVSWLHGQTTVSLAQGMVSVKAGERTARLTPGKQIVISGNAADLEVSAFNVDSLLRQHSDPDLYTFEDASLSDLCRMTGRMFGYRVVVHRPGLYGEVKLSGALQRSAGPTALFDQLKAMDLKLRFEVRDSTIHVF